MNRPGFFDLRVIYTKMANFVLANYCYTLLNCVRLKISSSIGQPKINMEFLGTFSHLGASFFKTPISKHKEAGNEQKQETHHQKRRSGC